MEWEKDSDTANAVAGSVPRDISVALCHTDCALTFPFVICEREYLPPAWEKGLCSLWLPVLFEIIFRKLFSFHKAGRGV